MTFPVWGLLSGLIFSLIILLRFGCLAECCAFALEGRLLVALLHPLMVVAFCRAAMAESLSAEHQLVLNLERLIEVHFRRMALPRFYARACGLSLPVLNKVCVKHRGCRCRL